MYLRDFLIILITISSFKLKFRYCNEEENLGEIENLEKFRTSSRNCEQRDEFYYKPLEKCLNCNNLSQIFLNYQEWSSSEEMSNILFSNNNNNNNNNNGASNGNKPNRNTANSWRYRPPSTAVELPDRNDESRGIRKKYSQDNDLILSRLLVTPSAGDRAIIVDPTFIDNEEVDQDDQNDLAYSNDLEDESSTSRAHYLNDKFQGTKQTIKLIDEFIKSAFVGDELLEAIDQCRRYQNDTACQFWSNLCVMTMYSYSDLLPSSSTSNMKLNTYTTKYRDSINDNNGNSGVDIDVDVDYIHSNRQWQKCKQFNVYSICDSFRSWHRNEKRLNREIKNIYALDEPLTKFGSTLSYKLNQAIQLLAYRYSYKGNLITIDQFGLDDMSKFCLTATNTHLNRIDNSRDFNGQIKLSGNMNLNCQLNTLNALNGHFNETTFIDLYLAYPLNGATLIRPVPILLRNLIYNGNQVNRKYQSDSSRWKLVYRYFPYAFLNLDHRANKEKILIYAKSAVLEFKFQSLDRGAFINSLILILDYGVTPRINQATFHNRNGTEQVYSRIKSQISIQQRLVDMQNYKKDLDLTITILSILGAVWSLIRCYNIQKCYGIVKLDLSLSVTLLMISCDTISTILFIVTQLHLSYIFIVFKSQSNVKVLAPSADLHETYLLNIQLAFILKSIGLLYKLYGNLTVDIFFIDWEKPKMLTSSQILSHQSKISSINNTQKLPVNEIKKMNDINSIQLPQKLITGAQQSSFWRPYTVVNRWLQMQTTRYQDLTIQLLSFVCLVEITNIENLSSSDTHFGGSSFQNSDNWNPKLGPYRDKSFRLLILSALYLLIAFIQIAIKRFLSEALFRNTIHEFVDLCSVANVSVFCMLYPRFGYYIHGRNANGSGDCGIVEINSLLEREERNLCSKRGLAPNSDQQTFIIILPRIINDHYKKLLTTNDPILFNNSNLTTNPQTNSNSNQFNRSKANLKHGSGFIKMALNIPLASSSFSMNRSAIGTLVARNKAINIFLTNFLNHIYKDIDYKVRECRKFECLLFDSDLDVENSTLNNPNLTSLDDKPAAATFCIDHNNSFTSLLWMGLEYDFILIELLAFITLDIWLEQPLVLTATILWLLHHGFKMIYEAYGRQNLIDKALVDEKFLLKHS